MNSVRPSEDVDFDSEVPVLIIGAGAAGLMRGARRERGRHRAGGDRARRGAVRIDRAVGRAHSGGRHALSGGAGHRGFAPTLFAEDIARKAHGEADAKLVRAVAEHAGPTVEWLADSFAMPFEVIADFNYPGHSAHRMHGLPSRTGAELIDRLRSAVEARDIPILTGRVCETLFADEDGFIEGVEIVRGRARDHRLRRAGARLQRLWRQSRTGAALHPRDGRGALFRTSGQSGRRGAVGRGARRAARRISAAIRATARSRRRTTS